MINYRKWLNKLQYFCMARYYKAINLVYKDILNAMANFNG